MDNISQQLKQLLKKAHAKSYAILRNALPEEVFYQVVVGLKHGDFKSRPEEAWKQDNVEIAKEVSHHIPVIFPCYRNDEADTVFDKGEESKVPRSSPKSGELWKGKHIVMAGIVPSMVIVNCDAQTLKDTLEAIAPRLSSVAIARTKEHLPKFYFDDGDDDKSSAMSRN